MRPSTKVAAIAASICSGAALLLAVTVSPASGQAAPATPASYINPDTGAATANPDVNPGSECETPDQADNQTVGDETSGAGNVHNDACLLDASGGNVDAQATFEVSGVGVISACPDPDGPDQPKTATRSADKKRCTVSGFEVGGTNGATGDGEYHARVVSASAGVQTVAFCADPEGDGCANAAARDEIVVTWTAASPTTTTPTSVVPRGGVQTGIAPTEANEAPVLPIAAGVTLLVAVGVLARRARNTG